MTGRWAEGEEVEAALDVDGGGWSVGVVRWIAGPDSSVSNVPLRLGLPPAPRDVDPPIKRPTKIRSDSTFDKKKMMKSHTGAVLRVLLILRVEIMESVRHHVFRIDRFLYIQTSITSQFSWPDWITKYLQTARDTLHGDCATTRIGGAILGVNRHWESVAQGHGSKTHFNADLGDFKRKLMDGDYNWQDRQIRLLLYLTKKFW